ncbi:Dynein family light intermediate chain [Cryptosporidium felis]|nr:Dynein family light intermediate chain [Cryptosporidium felis]
MGGISGKQEGQGLWQDILRSFAKGGDRKEGKDLHGTLFVLGRANGGKSELISELKRIAERTESKEATINLELGKSPYIGLDFCSFKVHNHFFHTDSESIQEENGEEGGKEEGQEESEDIKTATIDVWSVDHCGMLDELVSRLVDIFNKDYSTGGKAGGSENSNLNASMDLGGAQEEDSRDGGVGLCLQSPNIMFLIVLDSSIPWALNDDLVTWIQQIQECWSRSLELSNTSPVLQGVMIQDIFHYFEGDDGTLEKAEAGSEKTVALDTESGEVKTAEEGSTSIKKVPDGAYPKVNLGIPIGVVLTKSDIGQRFSVQTEGVGGQPLIPFSLSFLMNVGDSFGMSYFVTSIVTSGDIHQTFGVELLLRYILHRLFDTAFTDEEGRNLRNTNNVVFKNGSILSILPKTPLESLSLTPLPDVKTCIFEELVPKSKFSSGSESPDTCELIKGLSTAFDGRIPSLNEFLEQIKSQVPLLEPATPGSGSASPKLSPTISTNIEESRASGDSNINKGANLGSGSVSSESQRLKPSKSTLNSSNSSVSGDPSLKGFFQSLIQRGEKKGSQSHKSNLKPAPSMNLRKDFSGRIESKLSTETKDEVSEEARTGTGEPNVQTETRTEAEEKVDTETNAVSDSKAETETMAEPDPKAEAETKAESDSKAEPETSEEARTGAGAKEAAEEKPGETDVQGEETPE